MSQEPGQQSARHPVQPTTHTLNPNTNPPVVLAVRAVHPSVVVHGDTVRRLLLHEELHMVVGDERICRKEQPGGQLSTLRLVACGRACAANAKKTHAMPGRPCRIAWATGHVQ